MQTWPACDHRWTILRSNDQSVLNARAVVVASAATKAKKAGDKAGDVTGTSHFMRKFKGSIQKGGKP
jgi:hypothetical protein